MRSPSINTTLHSYGKRGLVVARCKKRSRKKKQQQQEKEGEEPLPREIALGIPQKCCIPPSKSSENSSKQPLKIDLPEFPSVVAAGQRSHWTPTTADLLPQPQAITLGSLWRPPPSEMPLLEPQIPALCHGPVQSCHIHHLSVPPFVSQEDTWHYLI